MVEEIKVVSDLSKDELEGATAVTGFRGFGLVGYLVSKHLALSLGSSKRGYILSPVMPPVVIVEDDGPGYPFDIYYSRDKRVLTIVHRANPEREVQDEYLYTLALWLREMGVGKVILVGGLNMEFMPREEKHGYRWLANRHYKGPQLEAPTMEAGLGVVGPLALLYMYLDYLGVPAAMVLPYSVAERVDYEAAIRGLKVIGGSIIGVEIPTDEIEKMASMQREILETLSRMIEGEEERESGGIYM
ncbi:proteasome assembly chaperone family protein [Aeropyrum camini]|uniref:Archaeal enzyme of ATP-grasp superfamily n=1 Tax=Aeropyrum camini SY1 = JCM 12091 TaxID=1198449 RepID=U3TE75_9CREN|nr:proteasome assembly chaperone family protein [Aeropyrum camini]BAN90736.1 archaeal enzyme of ATP-grasp superfamily [Aeropyrum camini SY1 = JCM 12091]